MTKIPFNIKYRPQIESGEYRVVTREDRPVEIKIWDLKGDFPVVGVYYDEKSNRDTAVQVTAEGRCSIKPDDDFSDDFFITTNKSVMWSKEDEVCYISIMEHLKYSITNGKPETYTNGRLTDWIENRVKFLRPQNHWKPSDEQMKALGVATNISNIPEKEYQELEKLYQDLKKLRED